MLTSFLPFGLDNTGYSAYDTGKKEKGGTEEYNGCDVVKVRASFNFTIFGEKVIDKRIEFATGRCTVGRHVVGAGDFCFHTNGCFSV